MVSPKKQSDTLITMLLFTHVLSWVLFMPMAQIQMLLFGRRIFSFIHYGMLEMILLFVLFMKRRGKLRFDSFAKKNVYVTIPFLVSWMINILVTSELTSFTVLFYLMNWVFPFLVVIAVYQYKYDVTTFLKFMFGIVIVHALIMWYQRFTNTIFWPFSTYEDGTPIFSADTYYNSSSRMARCLGLCVTSLDAGILLLFGIILTMTLPNIKKTNRIYLLTFFGISVYFTGTRNVYVLLAYIIGATVLMLLKISNTKKRRLLIFATIVASILYLCLILSISAYKTTGNLFTDTTSIGIRLGFWANTVKEISAGGIQKFLFGVMQWQNAGNSGVIDNMYLELTYCSGIFALIAYLKYIFSVAFFESRNGKLTSLICAAFTLSYCVYGVLNSTTNFYVTLIILLMLYCTKSVNEKCNTY